VLVLEKCGGGDGLPDRDGVVDDVGRKRQVQRCRVVLPFFGLCGILDPKAQAPSNSLYAVDQQIRWRERARFELRRFDFRVDGGIIRRLTSNGATILLLHVALASYHDGLDAFLLGHGDAEERARAGTPSVTDDHYFGRVEERYVGRGRIKWLAFLAQSKPVVC